jgi:hypothetical protein
MLPPGLPPWPRTKGRCFNAVTRSLPRFPLRSQAGGTMDQA